MATLETVFRDFLSLSEEEQQRFREMVRDDDGPSDDWWAAIRPELDKRLAEMRSGEAQSISAEESIRRMRERIRANGG